jgi:hypothetical protein
MPIVEGAVSDLFRKPLFFALYDWFLEVKPLSFALFLLYNFATIPAHLQFLCLQTNLRFKGLLANFSLFLKV